MRKFDFSIDEFYHIYNRGADKREIFTSQADYDRFVFLLYLANNEDPFSFKDIARGEASGKKSIFDHERAETLVDIGAYCLMPNHFHLVLKEKVEGGISLFVSKLCTGYSMYFNKKYDHSGTLFQGPFGASHLDEDVYLKYMYSYVHLNPIKLLDHNWKERRRASLRKFRDFLQKYKYSSFSDYIGVDREQAKILNKNAFPEYFSTILDFEDFINDWLSFLPEASPRAE